MRFSLYSYCCQCSIMIRIYVLLISQLLCVQSYSDYYWRDYDGTIPPDAIPADNSSTCVTYIGQVYVHYYGLRVGTINPGSKEIEVSCWGVMKIDLMIKILCAKDHSKYSWVKTTADTFKKDLEGQSPLVSGYDRMYWQLFGNAGILNIGRTHQNGRTIIGNVAAYNTATLWFYYPLNGRENVEPLTTQYEVLVYRDTPPEKNVEEDKNFTLF